MHSTTGSGCRSCGVDHCMHREHTKIRRSMLNQSVMKPKTNLEIRKLKGSKLECGRETDAAAGCEWRISLVSEFIGFFFLTILREVEFHSHSSIELS